MKNTLRYILFFFLLVSGTQLAYSQAIYIPKTYVQGQVRSQANQVGIPGLTISLVHPSLGRSNPVYTDNWGNFSMINVPVDPTDYFLEIYWGNNLVYRQVITTRNGPFIFQYPIYL